MIHAAASAAATTGNGRGRDELEHLEPLVVALRGLALAVVPADLVLELIARRTGRGRLSAHFAPSGQFVCTCLLFVTVFPW